MKLQKHKNGIDSTKINQLYKKHPIYTDPSECIFCGFTATKTIHFPQTKFVNLALRENGNDQDFYLIRVCGDCKNNTLDRKVFKLSNMCEVLNEIYTDENFMFRNAWTEEDYEELGYNLKTYVKSRMENDATATARIDFLTYRKHDIEGFGE